MLYVIRIGMGGRRLRGRLSVAVGLTAVAVIVTCAVLVAMTSTAYAATSAIEGTVTNAGVPQNRVVVTAFNAATFVNVKGVFTDGYGKYVIPGLAVGNYILKFSNTTPASLTQFYDHKGPITTATVLTTSSGTTLTVSADLAALTPPPTQVIQGTVTNDTVPLTRTVVSVWNAATHAYVGGVFTDTNGYYRIVGVPTGGYHLRFTGMSPSSLTQWYGHKTSVTDATTCTASEGATVTASSDLKWPPSGITQSIEGTVTYFGLPQERIVVGAFDAATDAYRSGVFTNAAGYYRITNLPVGSYHLRFIGISPDYISQIYDHQLMGLQFMSSAATVSVAAGQIRQISSDLAPILSIVGTLTSNGAPPSGMVSISAYNATTMQYVKTAASNGGVGTYSLPSLPPGSYKLKFQPQNSSDGPLGQWYDHGYSWSTATTITVLPTDWFPRQSFSADSDIATPTP